MSFNHETQLLKNISELIRRDSINDVRIRLNNGVQIEANKAILSAMSTLFKEKFEEKLPTKDHFLEVDFDISSTKEMLELVKEYLYTGKMNTENLSLKDLLDLLNLLRFLNLEIFSEVKEFTKTKINDGGFSFEKLLILSSTAEAKNFHEINDLMLNYIDLNINDVSKLPEVKYLSSDSLGNLLKKIEANNNNNYDDYHNKRFFPRFETLASWLTSNEVNDDLKLKFKSMFDLKKFSSQQLTSSVRKSKLFSESLIVDVLSLTVTSLEVEVEELRNDLEEKNQTCTNQLLNIKEIEAEKEALNKNVKTLQADKDVLKNNVKTLKVDNEALKKDVKTLRAEKEALKKDVKTLLAEKVKNVGPSRALSSYRQPDCFLGPPGAKLKYDLLSNSQRGFHYPLDHIGAFVAQTLPARKVNNQHQAYIPDAVTQDYSGMITIKAEECRGQIYSGRLESYQVWSTAQSADIKKRGYVEVHATLPANIIGGNQFKGSWPAIWMRDTRNNLINIVETINGEPRIHMTLHTASKSHQHPNPSSYHANADFTIDPLIAGFEWNIRDEKNQIDLTWWMSWYDIYHHKWVSVHTTKSLYAGVDKDYYGLHKSFTGEGFSLVINLAEGGDWPGHETFVEPIPHFMTVFSARVYGIN